MGEVSLSQTSHLLPENSEQSPMSASVISQSHRGCTNQAFEWGT